MAARISLCLMLLAVASRSSCSSSSFFVSFRLVFLVWLSVTFWFHGFDDRVGFVFLSGVLSWSQPLVQEYFRGYPHTVW